MSNIKVRQIEMAFGKLADVYLDTDAAASVGRAMFELLMHANDHRNIMQDDYWFGLCLNYDLNIWRAEENESTRAYRIALYSVNEDGDTDYDTPIWASGDIVDDSN